MITSEFKKALKLHPVPLFKLAWKVGTTPSVLYHLLNGHQRVRLGDVRLVKIARLINFPADQIFEMSPEKRNTPRSGGAHDVSGGAHAREQKQTYTGEL